MKRLVAIPVLALALAGCGSDSGNDQAASTNPSSTNPSSPPPMQTTPTCEPLAGAATTEQASPAIESRETMYLTNVSPGSEDCAYKIVFEFEKQEPGPGFQVSYQPATTAKVQDGSGNAVEIDGNAFLVVKLTPAMTAKIDGDQVTKTYTGPNRISADESSHVREVVKTGDFEAVVTWVIGLDEKRPFKTDATDSSLVVEIDGS
jgi:hypothetical protein